MNEIVIVEFPSNLGLKEPSPGHEPGVKLMPEFLREHNFHEKIGAARAVRFSPPAYGTSIDDVSKVRNADSIYGYAGVQAEAIKRNLKEGDFSLVLGGDCSILIGNAVALKSTGTYGLFFLDGHTDFMLPEQSQSKGAAGMDLAFVTGHGPEKLTNINGLKPYFQENHVWCVGNREYEKWYVDAILQSKINYTSLDMLRAQGIKQCAKSFGTMVKNEKLDGYWIHVDLDVLDDKIMPAVDSRNEDGLSYDEFNELVFLLLSDSQAVGIELTILDPELDSQGVHTREFVRNFCDTFNRAMYKRREE